MMGRSQRDLMRQVQKMQEQMARIQENLASTSLEGTAGGGVVTVTMNGHQQIQAIKIDPAVVDPEDVEMLQDLLLAALNDAQAKVQKLAAEKLGPFTGGMNIPGLG